MVKDGSLALEIALMYLGVCRIVTQKKLCTNMG